MSGLLKNSGFLALNGFMIRSGLLQSNGFLFTGAPPMTQTDLQNLGLTSEDIDARLIYLASIGTTGQLIDIRGNSPRTSASDAAFLTLQLADNTILEDNFAMPTDVALVSNETSITVNWTIAQAEVVGYTNGTAIERSTDNITFREIARVAYPTATYEDADPTLVEEVDYYYRLRAYVGKGTSAYTVPLGTLLNQRSWYGVEWDVTNSSPSVTRIASSVTDMSLHASLPIHSNMKGCLLADNGTVNYYLKADDWTKKADGSASALDGSNGQVMVEIPAYYRKFETDGNTRRVKISQYPLTDYEAVPKMYVSAYEAALDRTNSKLASLINTTTQYRGGNNTSAWDAAANTLLGKPATSITRTNYRTYARNRGANWQMYFYEAHKTLFWFFIVEYATRNSQAAVNATLTAQGYKQGGLGAGISIAVSGTWNTFNSYNPFVPCGATNALGNSSGEVDYTAVDFGGAGVNVAFKANRYRGVEMPFGHIWKNTDGINIEIQANDAGAESRVWLSKNPAHWNDANYTNFENKGLIARGNGYMSRALFGAGGEFVPSIASGGNTTYYCDYFYTSLPASSVSLRALFFGGAAHDSAYGGFGCSFTNYAPTNTNTYLGSRLCFLPA